MTDADKIVDAIESLTNATQYSPNTYLLAMVLNIVPVILGGLLAYYFTDKHWKNIASREAVTKKAVEICSLIDELQDDAIRYSLSDSSTTTEQELFTLELRVKSQTPLLSNLAKEFQNNCPEDHPTRTALETLYLDLYELATGEDFESRPKIMNKLKAAKLAKLLTTARSKVSGYTNYK